MPEKCKNILVQINYLHFFLMTKSAVLLELPVLIKLTQREENPTTIQAGRDVWVSPAPALHSKQGQLSNYIRGLCLGKFWLSSTSASSQAGGAFSTSANSQVGKAFSNSATFQAGGTFSTFTTSKIGEVFSASTSSWCCSRACLPSLRKISSQIRNIHQLFLKTLSN